MIIEKVVEEVGYLNQKHPAEIEVQHLDIINTYCPSLENTEQ